MTPKSEAKLWSNAEYFPGTPIPHRVNATDSNQRKFRFVSSFQVIKHLSRLVAMAEGFHAFPYRTRPLSLPAPMVLGPKGPGRVGRRQADIFPDSSVGRALDC